MVCRPKDQGGLGLKPLREWNEVLLMKHIWKIVEQKQNLWVQWVNRVKLKGRSIWDISVNDGDSWGWKSLLSLRDKMLHHVFHIIGDGCKTSTWYDTWSQHGPLSKFISKREIYDARFKDDENVADLIENGRWVWPNEWYTKFSVLSSISVPALNNEPDQVVWRNKNGHMGVFTLKEVWNDVRINHPVITWKNVVWFSQCTPRHTFVLWLALHKRLMTHDVIAKWNSGLTLNCSLCGHCSDSASYVLSMFIFKEGMEFN